MPSKEELNNGFMIGEWEVLPARGELRRGDELVKPEPKVFAVLLALAARNGDVVTKDELIDEVWAGRATGDDPIIRCVHQLRGHFGDKKKPYRYVDTLTKRGYCLKEKVRLKEPAEIAPEPDAIRPKTWRAIAVVALLALAIIVTKSLVGPDTGSIGSIGVLPCDNLSGNDADQYLVDGFKEELVQTLDSIPDFLVKHGRVTYPDLEVAEIAARLDVESVLFCAVRRDGDILKVNYHVARGSDAVNISSGGVTGSPGDIFALQADLAVTVRNDLLGESNQELGASTRVPEAAAYNRYIRGLHIFKQRAQLGYLEEAIELFEEAVELDPQYGQAYLSLAEAYALLPDARRAPLQEAHERAISIVARGIEVDPSISESANAVFGFVYHKQKRWALAEQAYLRAIHAQNVHPNAYNWYAIMLAGVGRLDDALHQALAALPLDPSSAVINSRIAIAYTWLGDDDKALEFFAASNQLGGTGPTQMLANSLVLSRQDDHVGAQRLVTAAVAAVGGTTDWIEPTFAGLRDSRERHNAIAALDHAAASQSINPQIEITIRAVLGDIDGAVRVARSLARRDVTLEMDLLFLPELLPVRQRPEFLEFMDSLGITEYWDEAGCVWNETAVQCPAII